MKPIVGKKYEIKCADGMHDIMVLDIYPNMIVGILAYDYVSDEIRWIARDSILPITPNTPTNE